MQKLLFYIPLCLLILSSCGSHSHNDEGEGHEMEEHEHEHSSGAVITPEKASQFGIEYEVVAPGTFNDVIKTSGVIEVSNTDINTLTSKRSGIINLSPGLTVGTAVNQGERIASISSEGIQGGDANQAAHANLSAAKAEYERLKPLYEQKLVTASAFREAERVYNEAKALAGKSASSSAAVVSPAAGVIMNIFVTSGEYVETGTPVATVVQNKSQILKADLPVREAAHLREITSANFQPESSSKVLRLSDLNGSKISDRHYQAVNGYIPLYFSFTGDPLTTPGGFAEVYLLCAPRTGVISVPRDAIIEIQGSKYVYVAEEEDEHDHEAGEEHEHNDAHGDVFEKRAVITGASDGHRIEILSGLEEGDKIVAKGASIVRMAEVSAIAPPAHTHNH